MGPLWSLKCLKLFALERTSLQSLLAFLTFPSAYLKPLGRSPGRLVLLITCCLHVLFHPSSYEFDRTSTRACFSYNLFVCTWNVALIKLKLHQSWLLFQHGSPCYAFAISVEIVRVTIQLNPGQGLDARVAQRLTNCCNIVAFKCLSGRKNRVGLLLSGLHYCNFKRKNRQYFRAAYFWVRHLGARRSRRVKS